MSDTFRIFVRGVPAPKGSMRAFVVKGRPIITSDNPKTRPWQRLVRERISAEWEGPAWDGPIEITLNFALLRPVSVSAKKRPWPCVKPDLDKLERTILDALVGAGAIRDDAQVCSVSKQKVYTDAVGVEIELRKLC